MYDFICKLYLSDSVTCVCIGLINAYSNRMSATTTSPPPKMHVLMLTSCYMYKNTTL